MIGLSFTITVNRTPPVYAPLPACGEQRRAGVPPVEATAEEGLGVGFLYTPKFLQT